MYLAFRVVGAKDNGRVLQAGSLKNALGNHLSLIFQTVAIAPCFSGGFCKFIKLQIHRLYL